MGDKKEAARVRKERDLILKEYPLPYLQEE